MKNSSKRYKTVSTEKKEHEMKSIIDEGGFFNLEEKI